MKDKVRMCPMPGCWRESLTKKGGFCSACSSWWNRISIKNGSEMAHYMQRLGRFTGRFGYMRNRKYMKAVK